MTDPAEKPAIARNVLTNAALIRLTDWARQNVESCQTLSNKTLATMAGETLNLHLTSANIASALEAVNITKIKPKAPPTLEERIAELDTFVSSHVLRIAELEQEVATLRMTLDAYLAAFGSRLNKLEAAVQFMPDWAKLQTEYPIDGIDTTNLATGIRPIRSIATQLGLIPDQYTPPEPVQIQTNLATDGPITVTPPMLRPGETLHGLPDPDTAVAKVKAEREREQNADDSLAPLTPIHGMTYAAYDAAATIGDEP